MELQSVNKLISYYKNFGFNIKIVQGSNDFVLAITLKFD